MDVFLTYCLLKESPDLSRQQQGAAKRNLDKVATCGRDLSLELLDGENPISLETWAENIFSDLAEVARLLDKAGQGENFQAALNYQHQKLVNPALTPSARMLREMEEQSLEVNELALDLAKKHRHKLIETDYSQIQASDFALEAVVSWQKQKELEESETLSFDDFHALTFDSVLPALPPSNKDKLCEKRTIILSRSSIEEPCQWPNLPWQRNASCKIVCSA